MKHSVFHRTVTGTRRSANFFDRHSRKSGGRARPYTEGVSVPSHAHRQNQSLLRDILLLVILPPYGIYRIWKNDSITLFVRIACIAFSFALMTLYFYWIIPAESPDIYQPTIVRPSAVTEYSPSSAGSESGF